MSTIRNFKDLLVWQAAVRLATQTYQLTRSFPPEERCGLQSQLRRAAVSIASNIAEGHSRQYDNEFRQFLHIALGSLAEMETQIHIANELKYLREADLHEVFGQIDEVRKMCWGMIRAIDRTCGLEN